MPPATRLACRERRLAVRFRSSCCLLVAARYGGLDGSFCWLVAAEVGVGRVYGVRGLLLRNGLSCIVRARLPE